MAEPIRLVHFADTHIGMENYGRINPHTGISERVMDFLRRMSEIVDYAKAHDADLAIFAGDAFRTRQPDPTYQREFARRIKALAEQCPVVLLVGNHDIPAMTQKASSVEIFHTLEVDNVIVGRSDRLYHIETKRGPVQVATVPYPVRQRLLSDLDTRGMSIGQLDVLLRDQVDLLIRNLADQVDPTIPAVLAGHFGVMGAQAGSEQYVMLGRDVAVLKSSLTDPIWDYVALGHVHRHQNLNPQGYPPVVYAGSIERVDFGEEHEPKGFCWVQLVRGATTYEFVELNARPFVTIRVDVRGHTDPTQTLVGAIVQQPIAEAVVRLIITATAEEKARIRERDVTAALEAAAFVAAVQYDIERPTRLRLGVEHPEGLGPLDLLERYLHTKKVAPERISLLKDYAAALFAGEDGAASEG